MRAFVDEDTCISCGLCADTCPEVFRMKDNDKAEAYADPVPAGQEECSRKAADQCPVEAITIKE